MKGCERSDAGSARRVGRKWRWNQTKGRMQSEKGMNERGNNTIIE